jgi:hypothetical protein
MACCEEEIKMMWILAGAYFSKETTFFCRQVSSCFGEAEYSGGVYLGANFMVGGW